MGILDNVESAWDEEFYFDPKTHKPELENLSQKLFSDLVCAECESKPIVETDNMGREKFWEDLGRP
jgi:hypothetical protein